MIPSSDSRTIVPFLFVFCIIEKNGKTSKQFMGIKKKNEKQNNNNNNKKKKKEMMMKRRVGIDERDRSGRCGESFCTLESLQNEAVQFFACNDQKKK